MGEVHALLVGYEARLHLNTNNNLVANVDSTSKSNAATGASLGDLIANVNGVSSSTGVPNQRSSI